MVLVSLGGFRSFLLLRDVCWILREEFVCWVVGIYEGNGCFWGMASYVRFCCARMGGLLEGGFKGGL
jgi:hypothetical protein